MMYNRLLGSVFMMNELKRLFKRRHEIEKASIQYTGIPHFLHSFNYFHYSISKNEASFRILDNVLISCKKEKRVIFWVRERKKGKNCGVFYVEWPNLESAYSQVSSAAQ